MYCNLFDQQRRAIEQRETESRDVLLHGAELDAHDELALAGNVLEYVGLETTQHVRTEQVVQSLDLLLLADVAERLQEALQVTASKRSRRRVRV